VSSRNYVPPEDQDRWRAIFSAASGPVAKAPAQICEICVQMLGVNGASISMVDEAGTRAMVCATDKISSQIEELQFTLGVGPCADAMAFSSPVLIDDLSNPDDYATERWPTFLTAVQALGVCAIFALPLRIGAINVGALDLYRLEPGPLDSAHLTAALMAADAAALALVQHHAGGPAHLDEDLGRSSMAEVQVHQATGMVQAQLGVSTDEAFVRLRAKAFALGRTIYAVAIDVVERRLRFTWEDE
jgi:GAF domain-containing protein